MWLSALVSKTQDMVSSCDSDQKPVKDGTTHFSAVESVAELAEIHLQVLGTGAMVGAVNKCLCVSDHVVQPFEHLTIRIKYFPFVIVAFSQRRPVCVKTVSLHSGSKGNAASGIGY